MKSAQYPMILDKERFQIEISDNNQAAAKGLLHSNLPTPAPLITPKNQK